jgi:hypothetical protein
VKKPSDQAGGFGENFSEWPGSRKSLESMEALDWVFNALDGARVDAAERKTIWSDDQSVSIERSVDRLRKGSGLNKLVILSHVIGWLRLECIPEGLDEDQMGRF